MANADALSRLPLRTTHSEVPQPPELVHLVEYLDSTPLSCTQIRTWTDHDPILSRVKRWVQEGWPAQDRRNLTICPSERRVEHGGGVCVVGE